ncbi:MAG TPA: HAD-IIIC family phosphatase, partial [Polyangiales bacterium]
MDAAPGARALPVQEPTQLERVPATRDVMRLLRTEQLGTPSAAHNIGTAARLRTRTDAQTLERILQGLARRHAALRTAIVANADQGYALEVVPALDRELLRSGRWEAAHDTNDPHTAQLSALMAEPFALERAPLWRFQLLEDEAGQQTLLFGAHHAVADLRSLLLVLAELDAELRGATLDQALSNRDLHALLRAQPQEQTAPSAPQIEWRKEFAGVKRLELTLASPRPPQPSYRSGTLSLPMPAGLMEQVAAAARSLAVTPAALYLGVLHALLARLSGQSRFVVAVPVDTRPHADAGDALGFFGVPVPLPGEAHPDQPLVEIVKRTDKLFERVLEKGAAFGKALPALVEEGLHREGAPLVEVYFNYINPQASSFKGLEMQDAGTGLSDVDLMLIVAPMLGRLRIDFHLDILDAAVTHDIGDAYLALLERVSASFVQRDTSLTVATLRLPAPLEETARASRPASLALAATFALGSLSELLELTFHEAGMPVVVEEAPYHQVLSSLLDPRSVFSSQELCAGVILLRAIDLVRYDAGMSGAALAALADEYGRAFVRLTERLGGKAPLLVGFLPAAESEPRFTAFEEKLAAQLAQLPTVCVMRGDDWTRHYPVDERFSRNTDAIGHLPFTPAFLASIALGATRKVWGLRRPPLKVVAVDGDNTLWSGIAGELGPDRVDLSGPRALLARRLLELRAAGVLLVLVSNNDPDTVQQVLERPESLLHAEHFSAISAAWEDKPSRLRAVAQKLSLGLDSFVFLDDNPVEI